MTLKYMDSRIIREIFLDFFKEKSHKIVPSAPITVKNDPTLLFTNAGMNQFKDFFLGNSSSKHLRIANTQKCLRVSGKHNDLEEVGLDTYHHTMFEMLGNWSFGDYFKKEAISWAWELLTQRYHLPPDRLYASIFEGDESEKLKKDDESKELWKKYLPENHILLGSKKDNFWEMGDFGPCGPCSEIHIDIRSDNERKQIDGKSLINKNHPEVIEIWNLVFIQYNRLSNGELKDLPSKHIDTGMGFERLAMIVQNKKSNYDTDIFQPIIHWITKETNINYGQNQKTDIAIRVVADHIRAVTFSIADGVLPSNNKAGYVIRRILRRAVRYGYTFLNFKKPFLYKILPILCEQFIDVFPEIVNQQDTITKIIKEEENSFLRTLGKGLKKLDSIIHSSQKIIEGKVAFELYDTYGFPLDLTTLIAEEHNLSIDHNGFAKEMKIQKQRSKKAGKISLDDWNIVHQKGYSQFVGYNEESVMTKILRYRKIYQNNKYLYQIVLEITPFYPESGGQVGDTGILEKDNKKIEIIDTVKENDLIIHLSRELPEELNGNFIASIDVKKREFIKNNHSATHLLHAALKKVLGAHVQQKGSLVNDKILRFDFSHFSKMTEKEIERTEEIVNEKIRENISLNEQIDVPIEKAKTLGAMALFGEKYGEKVRVITFDPQYSVELCGGTHVSKTGNIGLFKIISEASIASGVRRIEAITSWEAEKFYREKMHTLSEIENIFKNPKDLIKSIKNLIVENQSYQKQIEKIRLLQTNTIKKQLLHVLEKKANKNIIIYEGNFPSSESIKQIAFELKKEVENLVLIIAANIENKPMLTIMINENLVSDRLDASKMVKKMAIAIKGGGGGQPFYATAGGKDINGLKNAISIGKSYL